VARSHHQQIINTTEDLSATFNTFNVLWTPTAVVWSINGRAVFTMDKADDVPNMPMALRLDSRSGWIDLFPASASFDASFLSFEYTPPAA
jgi:beta-glucanase (GH16 family)